MWWRRLQRALPAGAPAGAADRAEERLLSTRANSDSNTAWRPPRPAFGHPDTRAAMWPPAFITPCTCFGLASVPSSRRACECERRRSLSYRQRPAASIHALARAKRTCKFRRFLWRSGRLHRRHAHFLCAGFSFKNDAHDYPRKRGLGGLCQRHVTLHSSPWDAG